MQGVEFEEENDLIRSPEHVRFVKPSPMAKAIVRHRMSKSEAQTTVLLILMALVLFASSGAVFFKTFSDRQLGMVIDPASLSQFEKYQLPENIRMYIH